MAANAYLAAKERYEEKAAAATAANDARESEIRRAGKKIQTLSDGELNELYASRNQHEYAWKVKRALETRMCGETPDTTAEPPEWALQAAQTAAGLSYSGLMAWGFMGSDPELDPNVVMRAILDTGIKQHVKAKEHWETTRQYCREDAAAAATEAKEDATYSENEKKAFVAIGKLTMDENWPNWQKEVARTWEKHLKNIVNPHFAEMEAMMASEELENEATEE